MRWRWVVLALAAALFAAAPGRAAAQNADSREIAAYRLTEATLAKYLRASGALAAVPKPASADADDDAEDADDPSIAQIAAKYDSIPAARRAISAAGLTTREYVVFTFALFQAGMGAWVVEQQGWSKLPPDVARANVEFYQRHKAQIDSVTAELKNRDDDPT
ncbi:MAG: hypothetical protein ACREMI_05145 [Gemmatimonadales bacterium]